VDPSGQACPTSSITHSIIIERSHEASPALVLNLYFLFIVQDIYDCTIGNKCAQSTGICVIKQQFSKNQFCGEIIISTKSLVKKITVDAEKM